MIVTDAQPHIYAQTYRVATIYLIIFDKSDVW